MLKTLDRYIIKKFLGAFFFTCLLFSLISTVIDFSDKVDKFVNAQMTTKQIWFEYYLNFLPYINGVLWPLFSLIAVIFVTSRLAKNAEVISILNAGVSYGRFLRPYLIAALFVAVLHFFGNHYLIPHSNFIRYEMDTNFLKKNKERGKFRDVHIYLTPQSSLYVRVYSKRDTMANLARIEHFEEGRLTSYMSAKSMKLIEIPRTWRLTDVQIRKIDSLGNEKLILIKESIDTMLNLYHTDFTYRAHDKDGMITPELQAAIAKEKVKGAGNSSLLEYELHRRSSEPFTILILTIIGVTLASRKVRGGIGLHLAIGVLLGALYIFISKFAFTFAANDLVSPILSTWIPNILFTVVAIYLSFKAQK